MRHAERDEAANPDSVRERNSIRGVDTARARFIRGAIEARPGSEIDKTTRAVQAGAFPTITTEAQGLDKFDQVSKMVHTKG